MKKIFLLFVVLLTLHSCEEPESAVCHRHIYFNNTDDRIIYVYSPMKMKTDSIYLYNLCSVEPKEIKKYMYAYRDCMEDLIEYAQEHHYRTQHVLYFSYKELTNDTQLFFKNMAGAIHFIKPIKVIDCNDSSLDFWRKNNFTIDIP